MLNSNGMWMLRVAIARIAAMYMRPYCTGLATVGGQSGVADKRLRATMFTP